VVLRSFIHTKSQRFRNKIFFCGCPKLSFVSIVCECLKNFIIYLGKYLCKGVISEKNIIAIKNGLVTFRYLENTGICKTRTLARADFLWLLLQHILPKGFRRVREYGFLHHNSKKLIQLIQYLFRMPISIISAVKKSKVYCSCCGGAMQFVRIIDKSLSWTKTKAIGN